MKDEAFRKLQHRLSIAEAKLAPLTADLLQAQEDRREQTTRADEMEHAAGGLAGMLADEVNAAGSTKLALLSTRTDLDLTQSLLREAQAALQQQEAELTALRPMVPALTADLAAARAEGDRLAMELDAQQADAALQAAAREQAEAERAAAAEAEEAALAKLASMDPKALARRVRKLRACNGTMARELLRWRQAEARKQREGACPSCGRVFLELRRAAG